MNNVLITGGNGLIGSEFTNVHKTTHSEFDLTDPSQVDQMFTKYQPEYVINTAAHVGGVLANMEYPGDFFKDNILLNTHIIDYAKQYNVKRLCCFTSTCVFPDKVEYPITEEMLHNGPPHTSNYAYAYAKRMVDVQISAYNKQFGTNFFTVIPTNVYGPHDNYDLVNGHVAPSLIHRCYLAKMNNENLTVWGSGKPLREFIFSRDVAKLCMYLLENYTENSPVILSTSTEISINDLVTLICDKMKFKNRIIFDSSKPDGQYKKNTDNSKLLSIVKDFSFTPIEEGIEETIEYFIQNYHHVRK